MLAAFILTWVMAFHNFQLSHGGSVDVVDTTVRGNLSDSRSIRFRFSLDSSDGQNSMVLKCGYYTTSGFQEVIRKIGLSGQMTSQLSRFDPYVDPSDSSILGFTIRDIRREDARDYYCTLDFVPANKPITTYKSQAAKFEVLIKPEWFNDDCLRDFDSEIEEGADLRIKCIVTGFPAPWLQCTLHKFSGDLVDGDNRIGPEMTNFTTRSFGRISKEARRIVCEAYAPDFITGTLTRVVDMPSQFKYSPFAVRFCEVYSRSDRAIQLRWLPILSNETYPELQYYAIEYYIEDIGTANLTRKRVAVFAPNNPSRDSIYIYDTLENLAPGRKYIITIFGVNSFREGQIYRLPEAILVSPSGTRSNSLDVALIGGIVGGVIGGIVLILIIVFLIIYCSKKKDAKAHYPTSYVEDAVDYPSQGGLNMYAQVGKGKPAQQRREPTSGYPDVVAGGEKKRYADSSLTPSYEMSTKAFV